MSVVYGLHVIDLALKLSNRLPRKRLVGMFPLILPVLSRESSTPYDTPYLRTVLE